MPAPMRGPRNNYNRSGPGTLLWNCTRCLRDKKRKKTVTTTHRAAAAAPTALLCMYTKLTSRLLRRHFNHINYLWSHYTYFYTGTKKNVTKSNPITYRARTSDAEAKVTAAYLFTYLGSYMIIVQIDMFLYIWMDVWVKMTKKTKKHPPQGDDASKV